MEDPLSYLAELPHPNDWRLKENRQFMKEVDEINFREIIENLHRLNSLEWDGYPPCYWFFRNYNFLKVNENGRRRVDILLTRVDPISFFPMVSFRDLQCFYLSMKDQYGCVDFNQIDFGKEIELKPV